MVYNFAVFLSVQISDHEDYNTIKTARDDLLKKLARLKQTKNPSKPMKELCPWLSEYRWYGAMDESVELPGQYKGNVAPNPKTSLKILKFNEATSILTSLRNPIKISCICSDGKTYSFLVKCEEDLRKDERIQHVQELMTAQMQLSKGCSQLKLSLRTYRVIPLDTNCGLISWIDNTDTISSFLEKSVNGWEKAKTSVGRAYQRFIEAAKDFRRNQRHANVRALIDYTPHEVRENSENDSIRTVFSKKKMNIHNFILPLIFIRLCKISKNAKSNCPEMRFKKLC